MRPRICSRFAVVGLIVLFALRPSIASADIGEGTSPPFALYLLPALGAIGEGTSSPFSLSLLPGFLVPHTVAATSAAFPVYFWPAAGSWGAASSAAFAVCAGGILISRVLPDHVNNNDTGVDLLIEGCGFQDETVHFDPPITVRSTHHWSNDQQIQQLHLNVDINPQQAGPITLRVQNGNGQLSNTQTLTVRTSLGTSLPHPRDFAPTFWFAPDEDWYPVSPFFADPSDSTQFTTPPAREAKYLLFQRSDRRQRATVYYWVYGTHPDEPLVTFPGTNDPCYVYEYWSYYLYDEYKWLGVLPLNKHQHDWERFFVFVRSSDLQVLALAASAHLELNVGNEFEYYPWNHYYAPFHPDVLVEKGSHANCPDINGDEEYEPIIDVNHCPAVAWGIHDGVLPHSRVPVSGPSGTPPSYRLVSLESLRSLVDRPELTDTWKNDDTREGYCATCATRFDRAKAILDLDPPRSRTFIHSDAELPDPANFWVDNLQGGCVVRGCWNPSLAWYVGHKPVEHAWEGKQAEYISTPTKLLRSCWLVQGVVAAGAVAATGQLGFLFRYAGGLPSKPTSEDGADGLGYAAVASDGSVGFDNAPEGMYTFVLNAAGAAPYQQTLQVSSNGASLGVNGNIVLVPQDSSFTLKTSLVTVDSVPIVWARVRVFAEDGTPVAESLTDPAGLTWTSLNSAKHYKVVLHYDRFADSLATITAAVGDTLTVPFRTPFRIVDVQTGAPLANALRQNYPNPFNPTTSIEFEMEKTEIIRLEILDVRGRFIKELQTGSVEAGHHRAIWDGRDRHGHSVPSGVYFCRLQGETFTRTMKLVLTR